MLQDLFSNVELLNVYLQLTDVSQEENISSQVNVLNSSWELFSGNTPIGFLALKAHSDLKQAASKKKLIC